MECELSLVGVRRYVLFPSVTFVECHQILLMTGIVCTVVHHYQLSTKGGKMRLGAYVNELTVAELHEQKAWAQEEIQRIEQSLLNTALNYIITQKERLDYCRNRVKQIETELQYR